MRIGIGWILACALAGWGCSDDSGSDGGGAGSGGNSSQVCYDLCQAQDTAEMAGNCPGIGLDACKGLCDLVAAGSGCAAELTALNECQLTGTFSCGLISAESDADCAAQEAAYDACESGGSAGSGGSGGTCSGADANGRCPQVACPCPDGTEMISGSTTENGQCACLDENTCLDLCF